MIRGLIDGTLEAVPPLTYNAPGSGLWRRLWGWEDERPGSLDGNVVVVTGGTRGIGAAIDESCRTLS